jgi:dTDP-4-dehydrorhamnose reductase
MDVLVTGAGGFLGGRMVRRLADHGHRVLAGMRSGSGEPPEGSDEVVELDLRNPAAITAAVDASRAAIVVHAAAIGDPRKCEAEPERARRINVQGTEAVVEGCRGSGARLVFFSTEQVFDGTGAPYGEEAEPRPLHEYGRTKAAGERATATLGDRGVIARVSLVYGRSAAEGRSASEQVLGAIRRGERPGLFVDETRTPVHVEDVALAIVELVGMDAPPRVLNLAGPERISRYDFGVALARAHRLDERMIDAAKQAGAAFVPARPRDLSLLTDLARRILKRPPRSLAEAIAET